MSCSQARTQRKGIREQGTGKNIFGENDSRRKRKLHNQNGEEIN
jgi:hypothetical protein